MRPISLAFLLLAGAALAGCSGTPYPPRGQAAAPAPTVPAQAAEAPSSGPPAAPGSEALPPPGAMEHAVSPSAGGQGSAKGDSGWVSSYPYGTAQGEGTAPGSEAPRTSQSAESSGVTEQGGLTPEVSGWSKRNVTSEQHRADIEACYRYAWSQVERDMQIDSDVATGDFNDDSGLGFTQLTRRMNLFDYRNRRTTLINSCMESKGYSKG